MDAVHATRLLLSLTIVLLALAAPAVAQTSPRPPALSAEAVILLDPEGRTVFAKNAEAERAPASLVKLMTLYLACEALEAGRADVDEPVTISPHAATTARYRMGLRAGQQVPLHVLLEGVAIASANDAAAALAEHLAGDEATFVGWMNDKAQEFGLAGTHFANPHGLPDPPARPRGIWRISPRDRCATIRCRGRCLGARRSSTTAGCTRDTSRCSPIQACTGAQDRLHQRGWL
jgi:D-alanyl-D-alanine carboxypeptidase (penicillin-binding protein 5/6)